MKKEDKCWRRAVKQGQENIDCSLQSNSVNTIQYKNKVNKQGTQNDAQKYR